MHAAQGTVCKILGQEEVKPHTVCYYLEQRDPDFAAKMVEVLCVYREVKILKKAAAVSKKTGLRTGDRPQHQHGLWSSCSAWLAQADAASVPSQTRHCSSKSF
jgi:hypothetical protein